MQLTARQPSRNLGWQTKRPEAVSARLTREIPTSRRMS